jgi:hypothetical protein
MWDVIDTVAVLGALGVIAWFWWTASRTVLDFSGKLTKQERVHAWFRLARVGGVAGLAIWLVLVIQYLATGH